MKDKTPTLSDNKITIYALDMNVYLEEDVREFIKELEKETMKLFSLTTFPKFHRLLKELAGSRLTSEEKYG